MGLASTAISKVGSGWNVQLRSNVRILLPFLKPYRIGFPDDAFPRICVISLQRVLWLKNWDLTDLTYTVTPGACWSTLEPTLGVVNACLPTMRPVLKKVFGKDVFARFKAHRSDSGHRRRWLYHNKGPSNYSNDLGRKSFQRLTDPQFPLTEREPAPKHSARSNDTTLSEITVMDNK